MNCSQINFQLGFYALLEKPWLIYRDAFCNLLPVSEIDQKKVCPTPQCRILSAVRCLRVFWHVQPCTWLGHSRTHHFLVFSQSLVDLLVCLETLSCCMLSSTWAGQVLLWQSIPKLGYCHFHAPQLLWGSTLGRLYLVYSRHVYCSGVQIIQFYTYLSKKHYSRSRDLCLCLLWQNSVWT